MQRLQFSIHIESEKSKIWNSLWDDTNYRRWARVFFEGSYAVTKNWQEGSIVHFLAPDQSGIYSRIEKHIQNSTIHFKHIGSVVGGKEQPIDEATKKWTGATETYTLSEEKGGVTLRVAIDIMDEHVGD